MDTVHDVDELGRSPHDRPFDFDGHRPSGREIAAILLPAIVGTALIVALALLCP